MAGLHLAVTIWVALLRNRITNALSSITGTTLGASGGVEAYALQTTELASHSHPAGSHTHSSGTLATDSQGAHQHDAFIGDDGHHHSGPPGGTNFRTNGGGNESVGATGTGSNFANTADASTGVKVQSTAGTAASADSKVASAGAHTHSVNTGSNR